MGRYLSNGVVVNVSVKKRKGSEDFNLKKEKARILKELNKYINVDDYDLTFYENSVSLDIKKNIFNDNIHKLIKEVNSLTNCSQYLFYNLWRDEYNTLDTNADSFNPENYPLELCQYDDNYVYESDYDKDHLYGDYYLRSKDGKLDETWTDYYCNYWLFWDESKLSKDLKIYVTFIPIWFDESKIGIEDDNYLLYVLNNFKSKYYTSLLSKNLLFFIMN